MIIYADDIYLYFSTKVIRLPCNNPPLETQSRGKVQYAKRREWEDMLCKMVMKEKHTVDMRKPTYYYIKSNSMHPCKPPK